MLFLFYTSIFTKHPHQFIYSTHLFNKIFILLHFFYYSHSWVLSLSLSDPTTVIITQPPSSRSPDLYTCFVFFFLFLILMVDRSRNLDPFNLKPKVDRNEGCEGWSDPFLYCGYEGWLDSKPKCLKKEELIDEWLKQRVNE